MTGAEMERTLSVLKDFQRDTVDYVFQRMYEDPDPATRFLVADEVGLGKTMIARGIVAKAVHHLSNKGVGRIDVVYICSNAGIARQNINRLNVTGTRDHRLPDRITLLPRDVRSLQKNKINFVSFTPGTSFNLGSGQGRANERALLYWLLPEDWRNNKAGAISVLTGSVRRERFESRVENHLSAWSVDEALREQFRANLAKADAAQADPAQGLGARFRALADQLGRRTTFDDDQKDERRRLVGALRGVLAATCIDSLEPDLVILDEFQRFRDLLRGKDEAAQLAHQLFTHQDVRVLMLSATPYKMYTLSEETAGDDHYADFVETVTFLQRDQVRTEAFRADLDRYRRELFRVGWDDGTALRSARDAVTGHLKRVMVRTERLASTPDRSGMLREVPARSSLEAGDIASFLQIQAVARALGHGDITEFWKSAPYLLNFMDDYALKEDLVAAIEKRDTATLTPAIHAADRALLASEDIDAYRKVDPANARLRALMADTVDRDMWRLLWMPPALPYYKPAGVFGSAPADLTKRLVFSAWQVVPKVVAGLLTYEAERRMMAVPDAGEPGAHASDARRTKGQRLSFSVSEGRPAGMPALGLLYPCVTLASEFDPLRLPRAEGDALPDLGEVLEVARARCRELLDPVVSDAESAGTQEDEAWYWAAPLLLDRHYHARATEEWFGQANLAATWRAGDAGAEEPDEEEQGTGARGWSQHVEAARRVLRGQETLGRPPADLADVIAWQALAGPAVCALRALNRIARGHRMTEPVVRNCAGAVAEGLRSLFNQPDVTVMLRHRHGEGEGQAVRDTPYWRHVLTYCAEGGLQAVLDEYAHVLLESNGLLDRSWKERGQVVADEMTKALNLRTAAVPIDRVEVHPETGQVAIAQEKLTLRARFAARYGGRTQDDTAQVQRSTDLQRAFNSPFWPFVLCSTSVGQEGLDFHPYCHAVVHWNLPSNPVDLEQREGRVHRYKGHAVRKNVAGRFGGEVLRRSESAVVDPWNQLFEKARQSRDPHESDLVPFWVYCVEGGSRIERHVPALPLSRDAVRADQLRRSLAVYRMAFGQSRQEDLISYLLGHVERSKLDELATELCVDLSPGRSPHRQATVSFDWNGADGDQATPVEQGHDGPGVLSLVSLERLLDDFARVQQPPPIRATVKMVASLLQAFSAVRGQRGSVVK
ncbi:MAG: DEAD/DEAH box helicase [Acidobacteria bacterium]|nr:DEAD/DEAH box helicase [Acidobacteriota bacterium]